MKIDKKIKAFTLSEIIVVLILTSIVVGLAFSVLGLVQKQMLAIKANYNQSLELKKLETSLWIDFNRYSYISYNTLDDELIFKNPLDSISYRFLIEGIIKDQDTFQVYIESKSVFLGAEETENKVDAIKIITSKDFQDKEIFVFKKNDATIYLD